jgi:hypothetical protein
VASVPPVAVNMRRAASAMFTIDRTENGGSIVMWSTVRDMRPEP